MLRSDSRARSARRSDPSAELELATDPARTLGDLVDGDEADPLRAGLGSALLRYLAELGLFPERHVVIVERAPFGGPLTVEVDGARHAIAIELADRIAVTS